MTVSSALKKAANTLNPKSSSNSNDRATATTTTASTGSKPTGIKLPTSTHPTSHSGHGHGVKTPKTPQDEAIAFFSGEADGAPVDVYELWLEDDGGPGHGKDVSVLSGGWLSGLRGENYAE